MCCYPLRMLCSLQGSLGQGIMLPIVPLPIVPKSVRVHVRACVLACVGQTLPSSCSTSCTIVQHVTKHVAVGVGMATGALLGALLLGAAGGVVVVRLLSRRQRSAERRPLYDVIS